MVAKKLKIQCKRPWTARSIPDISDYVDNCELHWSEIQNALKECSEDEVDELYECFNSAVDGVGDALFGEDVQDFKSYMEGLNDE